MKMLRKAQNIVEYAMLIGIVVAALIAMSVYFRNSVAGKWRESADTFGHGRLYPITEEAAPNTLYHVQFNIYKNGSLNKSAEQTMQLGVIHKCRKNFASLSSYSGSITKCSCNWKFPFPDGTISESYNYQWTTLEVPEGADPASGSFDVSFRNMWCPEGCCKTF